MNAKLEPLTFTVPLALSACSQAEQFQRYQSSPDKAKQVYLNTLAVSAVNFYLQCRGFETDLEASDSWNPVMQTLMDVADLKMKSGKLECRPVLPDATSVFVPAEVWSERLGYIAVLFDQSLRKATLLGFAPQVQTENFPLAQLQTIEELPIYLSQREPSVAPVKLNQWLQNVFEAGWQAVDQLWVPPQPALNFRGVPSTQNRDLASITRGKVLQFGDHLEAEQVALLVEILPSAAEVDISVKVCSMGRHSYLPPHLQLMVLDESETVVMQAQARSTKNIQLKFSGQPGEHFSVRVTLDNMSKSEPFVI